MSSSTHHRQSGRGTPLDDDDDSTRSHAIRVDVGSRVRRHTLEQIQGSGGPRILTLDRDELVLGRSSECSLRIESREVSRRHLRLIRREGEYACEDLGSRNGVYLNGVKIHSALLRNDDHLQIGDAVFVYRAGS